MEKYQRILDDLHEVYREVGFRDFIAALVEYDLTMAQELALWMEDVP